MTIPSASSRSLIEVKSSGSELAFIRVEDWVWEMWGGLFPLSSQYANLVQKRGKMYVLAPGANFRVFVHVTSSFACGSCQVYFYELLERKQSLLEVMAMERQQYLNTLQRKLLTRAMWGWTALFSEIETLDIPSQFDIFPEAYAWCPGKISL